MAAAAVRPGFRRYVLSVQYHGSSFLGFTRQVGQENCILADGTDLRGYHSVESCVRRALQQFLSPSTGGDADIVDDSYNTDLHYHYDNLQVSSRTDRGVHAIKNTLHVDVQTSVIQYVKPDSLHRGLNYYLRRRQEQTVEEDDNDIALIGVGSSSTTRRRIKNATQHLRNGEWERHHPYSDLRILAVKEAPLSMSNPLGPLHYQQPARVDWNARFSATSRTYAYRILHTVGDPDWAAPFEWDRSWRVTDSTAAPDLSLAAMRRGAECLIGTHDFTSFRAVGCVRESPVMTLDQISIGVEPMGVASLLGGVLEPSSTSTKDASSGQIITILVKGNAFLYRQVRNLVGCLMQVGRGKLPPEAVRDILEAKDRRQAPQTAPAHGLFLVDVVHEGIQI